MTVGAKTRRGSAYLLVLIVSITVTLVGVGTVSIMRVQSLVASHERDRAEARVLASSAVEIGLRAIRDASTNDPAGWRSAVATADLDVSTEIPVGRGTVQYLLLDDDGGSFDTDPDKPVYVQGVGRVGDATHKMQAVARPAGPAFSGLALPIFAGNDIDLTTGVVIQANGVMGTNADVIATSATVFPPVEAADQITGGTFHNTTVPFVDVRGVPSSEVFDYYLANGTPIDVDTLPAGGGNTVYLKQCVLSPDSNPFGPVNPEGIYLLDADGSRLIIRDVRIVGTLYVKNHLASSEITGSVNWQPAIPNYPALLIDGHDKPFGLAMSNADLVESVIGTNLNPVGTPYFGDEDTSTDDAYPSAIRGLVFSNSTFVLRPSHTRIEGVLFAKKKILSDPSALLEVIYDPIFAEDPPPGFFVADGNMRIASFSWGQPLD